MNNTTQIDPQCIGCEHLKNKQSGYCYMFKEKPINCKINTAEQDKKTVEKLYK